MLKSSTMRSLPENANVTSRRWGKSTKKPDKLC
jgi:hypothetical protein